jgi:hypothetical protein
MTIINIPCDNILRAVFNHQRNINMTKFKHICNSINDLYINVYEFYNDYFPIHTIIQYQNTVLRIYNSSDIISCIWVRDTGKLLSKEQLFDELVNNNYDILKVSRTFNAFLQICKEKGILLITEKDKT